METRAKYQGMGIEHVVRQIHAAGLSDYADEIAASLLPAARLLVQDGAPDAAGSTSLSHLGGVPFLPAGMPWPTWDCREFLEAEIVRAEAFFRANPRATFRRDSALKMRKRLADPPVPLAFIGQIFLREMSITASLEAWPKEGSLAFFYEPTQGGFDPVSRGHCRVLFVPEVELHAMEAPSGLNQYTRWPSKCVVFTREWTLPQRMALRGGETSIWKNEDYNTLIDALAENVLEKRVLHRCGGHPKEVQGEMTLECQLVTNGIYCGGPEGYKDPRRKELEKGASDWRLLLQVDTDDRIGWMWGDVGRIYFWARQQDIQAGKFENVWGILQCH